MAFQLKSLDELSMQSVLGKGTFGEVREATHLPSGRRVAIKSIEKAKLNRKRRDRVQQEVDILSSLNHGGICRLYQAVQDERFVLLVMEHLNGGDLFDLVQQRGPLDETREVRPLFLQLCEAVQHCHARGIVHHDIKLENCMLSLCPTSVAGKEQSVSGDDDDEDEASSMELQSQHAADEVDDNDRGEETDDEEEDSQGSASVKKRRQRTSGEASTQLALLPAEARVKLIDFGLACRVERPGQLLATFSGTEQYAAPEVLEGRAYDGFKTDAYSLGVVLYLLLTAAYPFSPDDVDLQLDEQTSPAFLASLPFPAHVSADARDLISGLLRPDPRRRLTVAAALRHPFLSLPADDEPAVDQGDALPADGPNPDELRAADALASLDYACDNMSLGY